MQNLIRRFLTAIVETSVAPVLSSEALTKLNAEYDIAWNAMTAIKDSRSKEAKDAKMAVWKIDGLIKSEEANIVKLQNDAKVAEMRNQRLALNQIQLDTFAALIAARADKKTTPDKLAELESLFNTAKENVDNELLAKYAASKTAKKSDGATDGTDNAPSASKLQILELARAGKSKKQIEEETGIPRSTVWHVINNAKKSGETFTNN